VAGLKFKTEKKPAPFVSAVAVCEGDVTVIRADATGALCSSRTIPETTPVVPALAGNARVSNAEMLNDQMVKRRRNIEKTSGEPQRQGITER
jgi:hypothetical protein